MISQSVIKNKPEKFQIVFSHRRNASEEVIESADLVTKMRKIIRIAMKLVSKQEMGTTVRSELTTCYCDLEIFFIITKNLI